MMYYFLINYTTFFFKKIAFIYPIIKMYEEHSFSPTFSFPPKGSKSI